MDPNYRYRVLTDHGSTHAAAVARISDEMSARGQNFDAANYVPKPHKFVSVTPRNGRDGAEETRAPRKTDQDYDTAEHVANFLQVYGLRNVTLHSDGRTGRIVDAIADVSGRNPLTVVIEFADGAREKFVGTCDFSC